MLRSVHADLYLAPLREGGSLPGLVEGDDLGTYVAKFVGAGQGRKALVAEVITGELARALGLPVPELVTLQIDPTMASCEPDEEVQDLLRASGGTNLGVDFLPGAIGFDPAAHPVDAELAARVVWLDVFTTNVDRSWRNPNLLVWHGQVWLIDHGASLIFHHSWPTAANSIAKPLAVDDHVLAGSLTEPALAVAHEEFAARIDQDLLTEVVGLIPEVWLVDEPGFGSVAELRTAYVEHLTARLAQARSWLPEVKR